MSAPLRSLDQEAPCHLGVRLGWTSRTCLCLHSVAKWLCLHHLDLLGRLTQLANRVLTGADIDVHAQVSRKALIPHTTGIVIGETAIVEEGVILMPHVVLGAVDSSATGRRHPHICAHAVIGAGAVVLGPVVVGSGARLGANAVVVNDVAAGQTVVGVPARPCQ